MSSFQKIDIERGINQTSFLYVWATGCGKSFALTAIYEHLKHYNEIDKAIILTSSIGVLNLKPELLKFSTTLRDEDIFVINSITELKGDERLILRRNEKIFIMGYDSFRMVNDYYDKVLHDRKKKTKYLKTAMPITNWFGDKKGIIFLDECHLLGNPSSLRSKSIFINLKSFKYRYLFSATPADKREKMYSLLKILDNKLINGLSYHNWLSQYVQIGNKWSKWGINDDTWNIDKWKQLNNELYNNYAVKREKSLLNIPADYDIPVIKINMSKEHRKIYEAFTRKVIDDVNVLSMTNGNTLIANMLNKFAYLQIAIDNPSLLIDTPRFDDFPIDLKNMILNFDYIKYINKLNILNNIIQEECIEKENKIIVFYYHPKTKNYLEQYLSQYKPFIVSREIPKEKRLETIEKFKKADSKILIASIMIANTSFTLTEAKANVYYENIYDYITYFQSRGRISRIGQTEETRTYHIRYNKSIDNLQQEALETKGEVLNSIAKKETFTSDEWIDLFNR